MLVYFGLLIPFYHKGCFKSLKKEAIDTLGVLSILVLSSNFINKIRLDKN